MKIKIPDYLTDRFVPDLESINLLEYFLISAVVSLLGIRAYLALSGYPQFGSGDFHIAHMLWGGLFMLAAIIVFASFINSHSKVIASVLGGIGFGMFIDELGKFITADNNYFYKPTIAILYVVFIVIFLAIRWLASISKYSPKTYLANAVEGLRELVIYDLDSAEKSRAMRYLKRCDDKDPIVTMLNKVINGANPETKNPSYYSKLKAKIFGWYQDAAHVKAVSKSLVVFFILYSMLSVASSAYTLAVDPQFPFAKTGSFLSAVVVGFLVMLGVRHYSKHRLLLSYKYLQRATLLSIFLFQFFNFLQNELSAIKALLLFVSVYLVLQYTIQAERLSVNKKS